MADPLVLDVYFSFRSPFCYLAAPRLASWAVQYDIEVRLRPVLPLVVRRPDFFQSANPLMVNYHNADFHRVADYLGLPVSGHWADPDPVVVEVINGIQTMSESQPHIFRLTYLGVLAEERGHGMQFVKEVSTLIWTMRNWHERDHLAAAVRRVGLDLLEMDTVIKRDESRFCQIAHRNLDDLTAAGHWGVPTIVFKGEPFFGQDRLDLVLWRMRENGLEERSE